MPVAISQPNNLRAENGMILEVGVAYGDKIGALVQPFGSDTPALVTADCAALVNAFVAAAVPLIAQMISVDAYVAFVEARGMTHGGHIPFRVDFQPADHPGMRGAGLEPGQVAALCLLYCSNNSPGPHGRLQVGKAFLPGIAEADISGDVVLPLIVSELENMEAVCANGLSIGSATAYRTGAARRIPGNILPQVIQVQGVAKVATQRRRLRRV
jgi:hypothetical protein